MGVAGGQVRVPGVRALGHGAVLVGTCEQIWKYDDRRNLGTPPNTQPCTPYLRGLFKPALPGPVALGATLWPPMSFCRKQRPFCRKASPQQVGIPARPPAWCPQWEFSSICLSLHLVGQLAPTPWHSLRARLHRGPQLPNQSHPPPAPLQDRRAARCWRRSPASHRTRTREPSTGLQSPQSLLPTRLTTSRSFTSHTCPPGTTACCWPLPHPSRRSRSPQQAAPHHPILLPEIIALPPFCSHHLLSFL